MQSHMRYFLCGVFYLEISMVSIQEMKKLRDKISDCFGVSPSVAGRVIGYYNGSGRGDMVAAMIAGDLSGVGPALAALGESIPEKIGPAATTAEKISTAAGDPVEKIKTARNASRIKEKNTGTQNTAIKDQPGSGAIYNDIPGKDHTSGATSPAKTEPDQLETVAGEIVPNESGLPDGLADMIYSAVDAFCKKHDFENMSKCRQTAWSSCCMYIGSYIFKKNRKILAGPAPKNGGFRYDFKKISQLCDIWVYMCGTFGKAPFISDFANFAGIDKTALYGVGGDYTPDHLTPARLQLLQKLREAQEMGLSGLIVDGRQNPTGALAALNHWHGWTQTREIIHTAGQGSQTAAALPVFDSGVGILPDKSVQ